MPFRSTNTLRDTSYIESFDQNKTAHNTTTIHCAPLHSEQSEISIDESLNPSEKISIDDAVKGKTNRPIRIYADGVYDLFHLGHAKQIQQVKRLFPKCETYLIVGVNSDEVVKARKGPTLMSEDERYESVRHCRYVDYVVDDAPWIIDEEFIQRHSIDFVAHDDIPYFSGNEKDVYAELKKKNMFVATNRTEGISTSDIISRVVRDYDKYAERNIKRGYSREELNYSRIREWLLKLANTLDVVFSYIWKV